MTRLAYYLDFFTMPVFMGLLVIASPPSGLAWLGAFAAGLLSWTLAEYGIHRWIFHRMFRRQHWMHHLHPASEDGAVPAFATHVVGLVTAFLAVAFLDRPIGLAGTTGFTLGYWLYAVVHHGIHRGWFHEFGLLGGVVRRHELHHEGHEDNFNFLLPIGDIAFGTFRPAPLSTWKSRR